MEFLNNLEERIIAIFKKPEQKFQATLKELYRLQKNLQSAYNLEDSFTGIVYFFEAISSWSDLEKIEDLVCAFKKISYRKRHRECYDEILQKLRTLKEYFVSAKFDYKINVRVKRGEKVTDNNVYIDSSYYLIARSVWWWKEQNEQKRDYYDEVSNQVKYFMNSYAKQIIVLVDDFRQLLKSS